MRLLPSRNSWLDTSASQRSVETFVLSVLLRSVTASDPFSNNNSVPSSNTSFKVARRKARPAACDCQLLFFTATAPSALKIQREVSADLLWNVPASLFSPIAGRKVKFRRDGSLSPFSFFLQTDTYYPHLIDAERCSATELKACDGFHLHGCWCDFSVFDCVTSVCQRAAGEVKHTEAPSQMKTLTF